MLQTIHTLQWQKHKFLCGLRYCLDITKALATRMHPSSYFVSPKFHLVLLFCVLVQPRGHYAQCAVLEGDARNAITIMKGLKRSEFVI
jgi:hypothetical protein